MERTKELYEAYMDEALLSEHIDDEYNYSLWLKGKTYNFKKQKQNEQN
jgi:hypothetical protein